MKFPGGSRLTPVQGAWLLALLTLGWLVFLFFPKPKPPPEPLPPFEIRSPSKLEQLGLPNNPDLKGLPDFFGIWASGADWRDNRTYFAYWHPGADAFAYYVEARRTGEKTYRFRLVMDPTKAGFVLDEDMPADSPLRLYRWPAAKAQVSAPPPPLPPAIETAPAQVPVRIDLPTQSASPPKP